MAVTLWGSYGSYLRSPKLSKEMRAQALPFYVFRQFVDKKDGLGKSAGDTVEFTKRLRIDTAGGTLTEGTAITANTIKVLKGSVVVTEYGNKVNYTQKLETLSEFNMKTEYEKGLVDDQVGVLDSAIATVFKTTVYKVVCTATTKAGVAFTTNGTATATAANNVSAYNIRAIVDKAKGDYKIPKIGSMYNCIGATNLISSIYDDLQAVAQYAEPEFRYKDEVGKYYATRFVEDNAVLDTTAGVSSYGEGLLFGDEAVAEAVALQEEVRYYEEEAGRSKYLLWYAILGFAKIWNLADNSTTPSGTERIIHITSA